MGARHVGEFGRQRGNVLPMKLAIAPLRTLAVALLLTVLMPPQHASASSIQQEPPSEQEADPAPLSPIGEARS